MVSFHSKHNTEKAGIYIFLVGLTNIMFKYKDEPMGWKHVCSLDIK